jgi:DNA-binding LytR/AlgR family response regulator
MTQSVSSLVRLLGQPFPLYKPARIAMAEALGSGVFVFVFLFVFQPFGLHSLPQPYKLPLTAGFGLITAAALLLGEGVLQKGFGYFLPEEKWTVGRQVLWKTFHLLLIGLSNAVYARQFPFMKSTPTEISGYLLITLAVSVFPITGLVLARYVRLLKTHASRAASTRPSPAILPATSNDCITLVAENEKDSVTVPAHALLYIQSSDNYATLLVQEGAVFRKELIRSSLSRLEEQVPAYVQRCHRSYLVNLHHVQSVSGNAQGYRLHLSASVEPVPVGRKYSKMVLQQLRMFLS